MKKYVVIDIRNAGFFVGNTTSFGCIRNPKKDVYCCISDPKCFYEGSEIIDDKIGKTSINELIASWKQTPKNNDYIIVDRKYVDVIEERYYEGEKFDKLKTQTDITNDGCIKAIDGGYLEYHDEDKTKKYVIKVDPNKKTSLCLYPLKKLENYKYYISKKDRQNIEKETNIILMPKREVELITKHQVSGLLHYLLGKRPPSYYRENKHVKSDKEIENLASECFVKANNKLLFDMGKDKTRLMTENFVTSKILFNSKRKKKTHYGKNKELPGLVTWETFYGHYSLWSNGTYHLGEFYKRAMNLFEELYGNKNFSKDYSFLDFLVEMSKKENNKKKLIELFTDGKCKCLCNLVSDINESQGLQTWSNFDGTNITPNLEQRSIEKGFVSLDATIIVPIDKNSKFERQFMTGLRFGRFGENGIANVVSLCNKEDINWDCYESINNITKV